MGKLPLEKLTANVADLVVGLKNLATKLDSFQDKVEARFDGVDKRFDRIDSRLDGHDAQFVSILGKLGEQDDLLHLIADTVSRHDDDLTHIKRALRHQRA
jgi:hypothetical protein